MNNTSTGTIMDALRIIVFSFGLVTLGLILFLICYKTRGLRKAIRCTLSDIMRRTEWSYECRMLRELNEQIKQYEQSVYELARDFNWSIPLAKTVLFSGVYTDPNRQKFTLTLRKGPDGKPIWHLKPVKMWVK